jgi:hypothetical protein
VRREASVGRRDEVVADRPAKEEGKEGGAHHENHHTSMDQEFSLSCESGKQIDVEIPDEEDPREEEEARGPDRGCAPIPGKKRLPLHRLHGKG